MGAKIGNITIWLNVHKDEDNQPDYRGKMDVEVNGQVTICNLSLWINSGIKGVATKLSGQITEAEIK